MNKYLKFILLFCITISSYKPLHGENRVVTSKSKLYKVTIPDKEWNLEKRSGEVTFLQNKNTHASAAFITNPINNKNLPLKVLVNHLLIEIKNKNVLQRSKSTIDGLKAINVVLKGDVDGNALKMNLFVAKKDKIAFNIIYWAHPDNYHNAVEEFDSLVKSFEFIK